VNAPRTVHLDGETMAEVLADLLSFGSCVRLVARGGSMSPWIRDGDVLTIAPAAASSRGRPRLGDVVAFRHPGSDRLVIHRLVSRSAGGWIARGDRCPTPDGFVANGDVLGIVTEATCGPRRRLHPQGAAGLLLAAASRFSLRLRDRMRPAVPETPGLR
jgi:hypothetical protein